MHASTQVPTSPSKHRQNQSLALAQHVRDQLKLLGQYKVEAQLIEALCNHTHRGWPSRFRSTLSHIEGEAHVRLLQELRECISLPTPNIADRIASTVSGTHLLPDDDIHHRSSFRGFPSRTISYILRIGTFILRLESLCSTQPRLGHNERTTSGWRASCQLCCAAGNLTGWPSTSTRGQCWCHRRCHVKPESQPDSK